MKITASDVVFMVDGVEVTGYADGGIVNAPGTPTLSEEDQFRSFVKAAEQYGVNIITVGDDFDMESNLMRRLISSGKFVIRRQSVKVYQPEPDQPKGFGPRNRWGNLK